MTGRDVGLDDLSGDGALLIGQRITAPTG
jgi:hypothetical protein